MPTPFSDRCLTVLDLAHDEARRRKRHSVGTEHVLLAILQLGTGAAADLLARTGVQLPAAQTQVDRLVPAEANRAMDEKLSWCPSVQQAVDLAAAVAGSRGHVFVGNQHVLLGILQQRATVASQVLAALGVDCESLRVEVLGLIDANVHGRAPCGSQYTV